MALGMTHPLTEVSSRGENCFPLSYYALSLKSRSARRMSPLRRADNRAKFMRQLARNWDTHLLEPKGFVQVCIGIVIGTSPLHVVTSVRAFVGSHSETALQVGHNHLHPHSSQYEYMVRNLPSLDVTWKMQF